MRDIQMRNRVKASILLSLILFMPFRALLHGEDTPAAGINAKVDQEHFLQLGQSSIVKILKLSTEQTTKIAELLKQRKEQLSVAKPEEQDKVSAENLKLLSAVLTEEQQKHFAQIIVEPKLVFNFRYQRWTDVLDWFASQANLSLTMDAPPPGTFNYSDKNEYTPAEAIDLLNGVLQSKNYTLIRRNKMLLVLDISEGIQENIIPKISLDELSKRGHFEYVRTVFPMEGRKAEDAQKEIEPLLGPFGKIVVLPKTNQLLVTEMAGKMRSFLAIIKSIPVPAPPKKAAAKPKPPVPELKTYDVKNLDAKATIETLVKLFGDVKAVHDPKATQISAFTIPAQHAAIKKVIEQLQAGETAAKFQLSVYEISNEDPAVLMENILLVTPGVRLRSDTNNHTLVAWASTQEHQKIKQTIEKLSQNPLGNKSSQVEIYSTKDLDASTTLTTLQSLFPHAKLTLNSNSEHLIAIAPASVQTGITAILDQFKTARTKKEKPELKFYPYDSTKLPAGVTEILAQAVENANVRIDAETKQLVVLATTKEHAKIALVLKQYIDAASKIVKTKSTLKFYPYDATKLPAGITGVLAQAVQNANVQLDPETNQLVVFATTHDHAKIEQVLKQYIEAATNSKKTKQLEIYSVNKIQISRLTTMLPTIQAEIPGLNITPDAQSGELAVWGTADQHQILVSILEKLKAEKSEELEFQLTTYPLKKSDPTSVLAMLQSLYPSTKILLDSTTNRLLVWTSSKEQESISKSLEKLISAKSSEELPRLDSYAISGMPASELITIIQPLVPNARLTVNTKTDSMIAWGIPEDHEKIQLAVSKMEKSNTPGNSLQLEVYKLTKVDPTTTLTLLQGLFPKARITVDPQSQKLIVFATPDDQIGIKNTLDELQPSKTSPHAENLQFHTLTKKPSANLLTVLQTLVPQAKITLEEDSQRVMAVATEEDHKTIQETIEKIEQSTKAMSKNSLEVYSVTPAQRKRFMAVYTSIQAELPGIQVVTDAEPGELSIWAKPEQHEMLKEIISKLHKKVSKSKKYVLVAYPLKDAEPTSALEVMTNLFPDTKIILDNETSRLLIWTSPDQHEMIQQAMEQIATGTDSDSVKNYKTYEIKKANTSIIATIIREMFSRVTLQEDGSTKTLMIRAKTSDHKKISELIKQLDVASSLKDEVRVYPTGDSDVGSVYNAIIRLVPQASLGIVYSTGTLIVNASPEDHEIIASAMKKIVGEDFKNTPRIMRIFKLRVMTTSQIQNIISQAHPNVKISQGSSSKKLVIWGREHELIKIADIISKLDIDDKPKEKSILAVIPLNGAVFSTMMNFLEADLKRGTQFIEDAIKDAVIVRGKERTVARIKIALKEIIENLPKKDKPTLIIYKTKSIAPSLAVTLIQSSVPNALFTLDSKENRILVRAIPKDHKIIAETLELIDTKEKKENVPYLKAHTVSANNQNTINQLITNAFSDEQGYQITPDSNNNRLVVLATEEQHEKISEIIEKFDGEESGSTTVLYKLKHTTPSAVWDIARSLTPQVLATWSGSSNILYSHATQEDQAKMKNLVEKMDVPDSEKDAIIKSYKINSRIFSSVSTMLENVMRKEKNFQITPDSTHNRLIILASEEQHQKIDTAIKEMEKDIPEKHESIVAYKLKHTTPNAIYSIAVSIVPNARITWATSINILYANATKEDQEKLKDLVEKMDIPEDDQESILKAYEINPENFSTTSNMIQNIMSREKHVQITVDSKNSRLIIQASEVQHAKIAKRLETLESQDVKAHAVIYTLKHTSTANIMTLVTPIAPNAVVSQDAANNKLIILANDKDHQSIKALIATMDVESDENPPRIKTYTVNSSNITAAYNVISRLMANKPSVQINMDQVNNRFVIFATDEDHKIIEAALKEIDKNVTDSYTEVYQLKNTNPNTINGVIANLIPGIKMTSDNRNKNLIVQGSEADHVKVKELIKKLDIAGTVQGQPYLVAYPINKADPNNIQNIFRNTIKNGKDVAISADDKAGTLVVFAREKQHEEISKLLKQFDEVTPGLRPEVYHFKFANPQTALSPLSTLTPRARIAVDTQTRSLLVTATDKDHQLIKEAITKLDNKDASDSGTVFKIHKISNAEPYNTLSMLQSLFARQADVRITLDSQNNSIAAVAMPAQQERIAEYLEEIDKNAKGQLSKVYKLKYSSPSSLSTVLRTLTPSAASVVDNAGNSLIVSATEVDHLKIQKMVDEMEAIGSESDENELKYYTVIKADLRTVYDALYQVYYQNNKVHISMDLRNNAIVVSALPEFHDRISKQIKTIEEQSEGVTSHVYRLNKSNPNSIYTILRTLTPQATVVPDTGTRSLVVSASEADHLRIKEIISQIDKKSENDLLLQAYEIKDTEASNVVSMLNNLFNDNPEVRLSLDSKNDSIVALASTEQHTQIVQFLEKIKSKAKKLHIEIYHFQETDPHRAYQVLYPLLPKATITYDQQNGTLVATASKEDHEIIAKTVKDIDGTDSPEHASKIKIYPIEKADSTSLLTILRTTFSKYNNTTITYDEKNDALVVLAPEFQQTKISKIIKDIEGSASGKSASKLVSYPLHNVKARSVMAMLRQLFRSQTPQVELSIIPESNILVAIAREEQHETIRSTIEKLRTTKPELEVFQLVNVDPVTANLAISELFDLYGNDTSGLSVDYDIESEQLFVRGSKSQIDEIRELLIKMGETQLRFKKSDKTSRIRVIPFSGNSEEVIDQIQKVWPRLRKNNIRIVTPSAVAPYLQKSKKKNQPIKKPVKKQENGMLEQVEGQLIETQFVFLEDVDQVTEEKPGTSIKKNDKDTEKSKPKENGSDGSAEILISPGVDSITIASDDLEALDQLESLLRNLAPHKSNRGSDFIVFQLKNSLATTVSNKLEQLFTKGNRNRRNSSTKRTRIVPDERLNAIIVYGSRKDLESIEDLLQFLDTEDAPETFASQKPYLILVENTQASRIELLLREVYRNQLSQPRNRNQAQFIIPTGVSPEVASALVQANTARSAPLLSISVDELTNSLIVSSPKALYEEIKELVAELDEKAGNNTTRGMTVVPLKKVNSKQMRRVLNDLIRSQNQKRRKRRNR